MLFTLLWIKGQLHLKLYLYYELDTVLQIKTPSKSSVQFYYVFYCIQKCTTNYDHYNLQHFMQTLYPFTPY